jgi:octaprenyl-diphosphate synthase
MSEGAHVGAAGRSPEAVPPRPSVKALATALGLCGPRLAAVEVEIQRNLTSSHGAIDEAGRYVGAGGGKRLRPLLVLLTSGLLDYRGDDDVLMGAVFELIHTASLVHDDIIDEAVTRRGRASANMVFGNTFTVLFGDYLYIHSMNMALRAKKLRVIEILAEATERMIEGEMLGNRLRGRSEVTREQHLEIVERKTAWLFSGCCRVAAVLAGARPEVEERLAAYGMALGVAFQLVDDLLDLTSDEATVGKPVASDLREGRLTLPWIDLMARGSDEDREAVQQVLRDGSFEKVSFRRLRAALERHGCLRDTRELALQQADRAREVMQAFPPGPYRDVLLEIPDTIVDRDR